MTSNENSDYLLRAAMSNGIEEADELANFMGQMQIESANFKSMNENLHYSGDGLIKHFYNRNGITDLDKANEIASKGPEFVADAIYGGRWGKEHLGNTEPGDGWKYHGRGYVQLTGREEYTRVGKALGLDLVNHPELAASQENAAQIAIYYWKSKVVANGHQKDVTGATYDINGGEKGLAERMAAATAWETKLVNGYVPDAPGVRLGHEGALKQGALGEAISTLQADLAALGYTDNRGQPLQPDGHFGRNTEAAVRAFQSDHGLLVDGIVSKNTLEALHGQRQLRNGILALTAELEGNPHAQFGTFDRTDRVPAQRDPHGRALPEINAQSLNPFANPRHPDHGLYAELKERIPDASENRLAELTAACHMVGIKPGQLGDIHIGRQGIVLRPDGFGLHAVVDNSVPAPPIQQTVQQVQAFDFQQAHQAKLDAQLTQTQTAPVMGGPGGYGR